jgi:hypothetical protein
MMTRPNANPTSALECCSRSSSVASRQSSRRELDSWIRAAAFARVRVRIALALARRASSTRATRAFASLDREPSRTWPAIALEPRGAARRAPAARLVEYEE